MEAHLLAGALLLASAVNAPVDGPQKVIATVKSLNDFGQCFVGLQERRGFSWRFVPSDGGGVFSDAGRNGVAGTFELRFREGRPKSQVIVVMLDPERDAAARIDADVNHCI
jgi:hypothetical protein